MNVVAVISYGSPVTSDTKQVQTYQVYDVTAKKMWHHVTKNMNNSKNFKKNAAFSTFFTQKCVLTCMSDNVKLQM